MSAAYQALVLDLDGTLVTDEGGVRTRRTATLAFEDGTRAEVEVLDSVEVLHADEVGVAELSGARLTRFTRIPV